MAKKSTPSAQSTPHKTAPHTISSQNDSPQNDSSQKSFSCDAILQVIKTVEEFVALERQWQELSANCSQECAFACWEWAFCWWKHFCQSDLGSPACPNLERTLYVLCVRDEKGRLDGVVPFYNRTDDTKVAPAQELRLFGDNGREGEGMTDEPLLLLRRGCEQKALDSILAHLLQRQQPAPNFFKLCLQNPQPLLARSSFLSAPGRKKPSIWIKLPFWIKLHNRWEAVRGDRLQVREDYLQRQWFARRWLLETKYQQGTELVALPGSWEVFRRSLSRSMRDNLNYYPRRLEKDGHTLNIQIAKTPQEVRAATFVLTTLHNHRAQSLRGSKHVSHIPTSQHQCFLTDCLPRMAAQAQAFIGLVTINGQVIAAQAFLEAGSTLTVYYSGFHSDWYDYSPLTILHAEVIKGAILRGVQHINFLPGQGQWKKRWGSSPQGVTETVVGLHTSPSALVRVILRFSSQVLSRHMPQ